ncbi:NAD(P)H-flavin reductase [Shewanella sp. NFH-SH190041]|uniref:NAD(P)H-flavin reductase n=1 Tax=Shewanella sp. NFH-SH190041 TaxID=2950245 RepID=UPI0021C27DD8|nr:NAD(P)H-flavin reductase [Shewanella sp. NFH-SH190041]BDM63056.1 NAD(P)H-flavin reductase [Shewanella sp. NFH-SH190041]
MKTIRCQVEKITPFNGAVYQVLLRPDTPLAHQAGQYLCVVMGEKDKRAFSIASAADAEVIELHIGAAVNEPYPMQVVEKLQQNSHIDIEAPGGEAWLRHDSTRPRLLIAGGTGFSYIKSLIEQQIQLGQTIETTLYWGCRNQDAMYYEQLARQWHSEHPWLHFVPVVEEAKPQWDGKQGNLLAQIQQDYTSLAGFDVYIAGRFDMVGAAREIFRQLNVDEAHLYGDAFAFIK